MPDDPAVDPATGPVGFGRQMAQLVVIPAAIAVGCVVVVLMFAYLTGRPDSVETQLLQLRQTSGLGRLPMGLQDPRYKDRGRAAASLAQSIRTIDDPRQRATLSMSLADILANDIGPQEHLLRAYVLLALAQLGQAESVGPIVEHLSHADATVSAAAVQALLQHPDREAARQGVEALRALLARQEARVRSLAAAALGALARDDDQATKSALRDAISGTGMDYRESRWNATVALARLGDADAAHGVAALLLNRESLAAMPVETDRGEGRMLSVDDQTRLLLAVLAAAPMIDETSVWQRVEQLAADDPDVAVRRRARQLLEQRPSNG